MTPVAFWEHGAPFARGQGAYGVAFALYYTTGIGSAATSSRSTRWRSVSRARRQRDHERRGRPGRRRGRAGARGRARRALTGARGADRRPRRGAVERGRARDPSHRGRGDARAADSRLAAKMRHWKMGLRGSHVSSWLLDRRIEWGSSAFDPLINEAILVYRAFDSWEGTKRLHGRHARQRHLGRRRSADGVHLLRTRDPTSVSPEGHTILRAEECFPIRSRAGRTRGLGRPAAARAAPARNEMMGELIPGWHEMVLDQYEWTRSTTGGSTAPRSSDRSSAATSARTSGCSTACPTGCRSKACTCRTAVWPVGLSWMAAGYNAAQVVAEDAGVRRSPGGARGRASGTWGTSTACSHPSSTTAR